MLAADAEGRGELVQLLSTLFIKYGTAELQRSIEAVTAQACEPVGGAVFSCFDGRKIVKGSIVQIQLGAAVRRNQAAWCRYVVRSIAFFVDSYVIYIQFLPLNLYSGALPFLMLSVSRKLL